MMKKKISILTLAFLFLISTTGMPIWSHYCEMMGEKTVSKCEVCKVDTEKIKPSCCAEETEESSPTISSGNPDCCQDELVYHRVEDEFVINKSDVNTFSSTLNLFQSVTINPSESVFSFEVSFYCDSSPPFLINSELYISNSVLLI